MRLITSIVLSALAIALAGCDGSNDKPVRIGIHVWPGYDTVILAREKGMLDTDAVQLIELPSASESIRAFQNRTVDGAFLTLDEVLRLADNSHEPRVILLMDFSNGADVVLAKPEITNLAGLKGKSIGIEPNALGSYILARMLSAAKLSISDVKVVSMPIGETEEAYKTGRVDAVVTYEPHRTRILSAGARTIFDSTKIPGEIADVLVVRKDVIASSPSALQNLVSAQFKALAYLNKHPKEAAAILAPREKVSPQEFLSSLEGLVLPGRKSNQKLLAHNDQTLPATIRRLSKIMRANGILKSDVSKREYRDDRFVRSAKP